MARTRKSILPLNLYKYDVLIEDNRTRSEYFKVTQFDGFLQGGRNGFLLAGASVLRPGSKILVEILNKDGTTVYSAPVPSFVEGTSRLIQVEVYEDTPIGPGKIVVLGCADTYLDGTPIPPEWQGKYNVRWIADVVISPLIENKSPIRFVIKPTMTVNEIFYPSPATASFSESISLPIDVTLIPKYYNIFQNGYQLKINNTTNTLYTSEYQGATITGSIKFLNGSSPETASIQLPITKIYNQTLAESVGSLIYTNTSKTLVVGGYLSSSAKYSTEINPFGTVPITSSVNLIYDKLVATATSSLTSFANIRIVDTETISGEVHQVRISYKSTTSPGEYLLLANIPVSVQELLVANSSSNIVQLGKFTTVDLPKYWYAATMSLEKNSTDPTIPNYYYSASIPTNLTVQQSSVDLLDSIRVTVPIENNTYKSSSYFIGTTNSSSVLLFPRTEYTLAFDALVAKRSSSVTLNQNDYSLEVYLVPQENTTTRLLTDDSRGQLIGTITPQNNFQKQNFDRLELNFTPEIVESSPFGIRFISYGGFWNIANVSLKPAEENFFSPDEINILVPIRDFGNSIVSFKTEFLDVNNNSSGVYVESIPIYFTGSSVLSTLTALTDVDIANKTLGDVLYYDGSSWIGSKQLSGSYAITGSLTISGSGTFTNIGPAVFMSGNVGIGTNSPTSNLQIQGNVSASSYTSSIINAVGFVGTSSFAQTSNVANSVSFTTFSNASYYFPQNVNVEGRLTAQEFYTEFVTSSIIYDSGSTRFGDSLDDTHIFTGSLRVNGSITGSLFGTSSFATTASYVIPILPKC